MSKSTLNTEPDQFLHVAVGIIRNAKGDVLIAKRAKNLHQGGLWEFPGGKVELGETVEQALKRELFEELGIDIEQIAPLIKVHHAYSDRNVLLDVWQIDSFSGEAYGKEQQPICWVPAGELKNYSFPEANLPIRRAVELPLLYGILDVHANDDEVEVIKKLTLILKAGCELVQFRGKKLEAGSYHDLAFLVKEHCHRSGAKLLLNSSSSMVEMTESAGVHLSTQQLMALSSRPLGGHFLVSASCHNKEELQHACRIAVDFVVLSPVLKTTSHPKAVPLGWENFGELVEGCDVPVYALGGLQLSDQEMARRFGAQGIAGISLFQLK